MRIAGLAAPLALALAAASCGDDPRSARREPVVVLKLAGPADGTVVRRDSVSIRGSVQPRGAQVKVLGRDVAVDGGGFSTDVALEPGANLIDVAAAAPGRRPDFAVARVVREVHLPVPALVGSDADSARDQLERLGLTARSVDAGGFFDPLLPGDPKVCEQRPRAGAQALPGSEVTLHVARDC